MTDKKIEKIKTVALAGNPNVGKSTIFNALTGMNQHTGNWAGKTVANAKGYCKTENNSYVMIDLPGTYSLMAHSPEEEIARDFICNENPDAVLVICDATCLERNLNMVLQTAKISKRVVVCINLIDEAKRKKISVDTKKLSEILGMRVIETNARNKKSIVAVMQALDECLKDDPYSHKSFEVDNVEDIIKKCEEIASKTVRYESEKYNSFDRCADKILTSKVFGYAAMLLMLLGVFWLTVVGANYPSELLSNMFYYLGHLFHKFFSLCNAPEWLDSMLVSGVYETLARVVSVMLPPMAIFFPLFTLLEDMGYLPRIAYNLDKPFKCCNSCGKQALTMCMGFGCNAVGVVGCRIIDSPRERLLAILTNSLVPCNGRFPALITIITIFFTGIAGNADSALSALILSTIIVFSVLITFITTKILSKTLLKGESSSFVLELPPYRKPQILKVIIRSVFDRTLYVLGRALKVSAPAGLIIWIISNLQIGGVSLLQYGSDFLDPFARLMGLDGVILIAFILGFPANEIVIPIMIMAYTAQGCIVDIGEISKIGEIFIQNGWTWQTAVSVILFSLMHWPCSTTVLTIKKETGNWKWAVLSVIIPTVLGIICCMAFNLINIIL